MGNFDGADGIGEQGWQQLGRGFHLNDLSVQGDARMVVRARNKLP
jgi:hypothetical protein